MGRFAILKVTKPQTIESIKETQADGTGVPKDLEKSITALGSTIAELKAVVGDFKNSSSTSGNNIDIEGIRSLNATIAELKKVIEELKNSSGTSGNSVDIEKISEDIKKISDEIKNDNTATKTVEDIKKNLSKVKDYVENIWACLPSDADKSVKNLEKNITEVKLDISELKLLDKKIDAVEKKFNGRFNEVVEPITEIKRNIGDFGEKLEQIQKNTERKKLSTKKKLAILMVVIVMFLSVTLGCGLWYGLPKGDLRYEYSAKYDGYIVYAKDYTMENLVIPSIYQGKEVVGFRGPKKDNNKNLVSVVLPETLQEIECGAFSGCSKLKTIILPFVGASKDGGSSASGDTLLGYIFGENEYKGSVEVEQKFGKSNLETKIYYMPQTLTEVTVLGGNLYYGAFSGCRSLTDVILKDENTLVGPNAFMNSNENLSLYCEFDESISNKWDKDWKSEELKIIWNWYVADNGVSYALKDGEATIIKQTKFNDNVITVPSHIMHNGSFEVVAIGESAFNQCTSLTSVIIPSSVKSIGNSAFKDCSNLEEVTFEKDSELIDIGKYAFSGCSNLKSIEIPIETTSIDDYAFQKCTSLENIEFDDTSKLKSIGTYAFEDCNNIMFITIPIGVTSIDGYAFSGCNALTIKCLESEEQSDWSVNWNQISKDSDSKYPVIWDCKNNDVADDGNIYFKASNGIKLALKDGVATVVRQPILTRGYIELSEECEYDDGTSYYLNYIADSAFEGCVNLTSISIPSSIKEIGADAFKDCQEMKSDDLKGLIGVHITDIASWCAIEFGNSYSNPLFYAHNLILNDSLVTTLIIPEDISVSDYAFYNCTSLLCVSYAPEAQNSVSIGANAFYGCNGLISVYIPSYVMSIGENAFSGSSSLTIYCEVQSKPNSGWHSTWISGDMKVVWGQNNTTKDKIYDYVIHNDKVYLTKYKGTERDIEIPSTIDGKDVVYFGEIFKNNKTITSIEIPINITTISPAAFINCSSLRSINVDLGNISYASQDGILYNKEKTEFIHIPKDIRGEIKIPFGIKSIGNTAFSGCSSLTSILIPVGVISIVEKAFYGCSSLTIYCEVQSKPSGWNSNWISSDMKVVWGQNNITKDKIYDYVVHKDKVYLTKYKGTETDVEIPSTIDGKDVVYFGEIFKNNKTITSIEIPINITTISPTAFLDCSSLRSINVDLGNASYASQDGILYNKEKTKFIHIPKDIRGEIKIPIGITSIDKSAFDCCSSLTSIKIPSSITSIGKDAFLKCSSLTGVYITDIASWCAIDFSNYYANPLFYAKNLYLNNELVTDLVIPSSVTSIGENAFVGCSSLKSLEIPSSVTSIGFQAFGCCSSLTSIGISSSVKSIGDYAFLDCSSLTGVYITDIASWCAIDFSNYYANPLFYAKNLYLNNELVTDLVIPSSVTSIGENAFVGCSSLKSLEIPSSVTSIGFQAFWGCSSLTSIVIPSSVTSIGNYAFSKCSNLIIYCEAESKPKGWYSNWNNNNRPVVWGYKSKK